MIIHAEGPIYGYYCENCKRHYDEIIHFENYATHQMVPVQPITAVHALRCIKHLVKPIQNTNAGEKGECGYCETMSLAGALEEANIEITRLGRLVECQCRPCLDRRDAGMGRHMGDCSVHGEPANEPLPCDCTPR